MKEFLKQLASKLIFAALKFYQNKTLQEIKKELARQYAGLAQGISQGSRAAFFALVGAALAGVGLLLLPVSICVGVMALTTDRPGLGLAISAGILFVFMLIYIVVPLFACLLLTSEKSVRKALKVDDFERRMLDR